jgi:hypothetical protein
MMVEAATAAQRGRALFVLALPMRPMPVNVPRKLLVPKDAAQQPAAREVVGIDDAAVAQLDALARPVDPGKVEVEGRLDDAEDDGDGVGLLVVGVEPAPYPVEQVQAAVGAEEDDVEGGDDGRDRGLPEEEELREDADGFEDLRKDPEPLFFGGLVRWNRGW